MFTGIVQALIPIARIEHQQDISRLHLNLGQLSQDLELGASVAVNGTCLTVTEVVDTTVSFDVIAQTLRMTNLGALETGDRVNVERSFRVGDEVGGHVVSGHISGTSQLLQRHVSGNDHVLRLALGAEWKQFVFDKGFIAVDGASLTVSALDRAENWFEISLIPETLARTTLGSLSEGKHVNIEVDSQTVAIVETVERVLAERAQGVPS